MSWAKLSDDYSDDCWTLSDQAFRLHTEALVWNGRKLLDCRIPRDDLRRFATHLDAVTELLACGWWSEDGDVYVIRHHAQYQRTREAVVNQQAANSANGAKGGRPRKPREQAPHIKKTQSVTQSVTQSLTETETERDRPGQDSTWDPSSQKPSDSRFWKSPEEMGTDAEAAICAGCGDPLHPSLARAGETTHATCESAYEEVAR